MKWLTYIGVSAYILLVLFYGFNDHDQEPEFWGAYFNLTAAYIGTLGMLLNFKKEKSENEITIIVFATIVRAMLFVILIVYYTFGDTFLNSSLSFIIWFIVAGFLSLIYKIYKHGK